MSSEKLSQTIQFVNSATRAAKVTPFTTESESSLNSSQHAGRSHKPISVNRATLVRKHAQLSPLIWWRTREPRLRLCQSICEIREALLGTEIRGQPDWSRAILGDAAIAIGVAADQMKVHVITAAEVDLALSAVLACALEGDPASPIVISSALRRRAKDDPSCKPLSDLWLVAKF
jgi:hypothetical protein